MKKLTVRQFATVKRVAQNVNPLVIKRNKLADKVGELQIEMECLQNEINGHEAGIKALTGGYSSESLVKKVTEATDKTDKDGNVIKVTKYLPTSIVSFDKENNCYYIAEPENQKWVNYETEPIPVPSTIDGVTAVGSDFDIDSEILNN